MTLARVIFRCEISHFTTFAKILVFSPQKQTGQLYSCCQYHIVSLQYQKFTINLQLGFPPNKRCNLRNFAFQNISQNLGFLLLEKDLTTLQLLRILHGIKIISKVFNNGYSRDYLKKDLYFAKFCILQLLLASWFSVFRRGLGNFGAALSIRQYHYHNAASQKVFSQEYLQRNLYFVKFRSLQIFREPWFSTLTKGLGNFATVYYAMLSLS